MTNWRETGYVPDSDAEDDSDTPIDAEEYQKPLSNTNKQNTPTTASQPSLNASGSDNNLPSSLKVQVPSRISYKGLGVLDLSDLPDEDEGEKIEEKPEKQAKSNPEHHRPQILSEPSDGEHPASQSARSQVRQHPQAVRNNLSKPPLTPTRRDLPLASSQEFSPLSDAPSNLSSPPGFWSTRQTRSTAFSIVLPPVPTSNYSAVSNSPTSPSPTTDEFTSGPLHNLRQRKPIQLNPYLIEQARYRKTLKSRGIKPIVFKSTDVPEASVRPYSEEEEYEASNDDEDESQPRRRRHADGADLHLDEIRLAQTQVTETLQEDDWDFPDVSTILQMPIRKDGAGLPGMKRRKLVHTYGTKHASAKPRPVWKQPMLSPDHRAPRFTNTLPPNGHRSVTPPITRDPPSASLDGSPPVRLSQRRPLIQHSINTMSPVNIVSSDDNTTPRASPRHRTRAVSISSSSSSSSVSSDPSDVDFRRLQKRTNGVLPASWWKLDYEKKKKQQETAAIQRHRNSVTPDRNIHQPRLGVVRAKISKKPRPAAENILSFIDNDESKSDSSELEIMHAAIVPRSIQTEIIYQDKDDARRWPSLDDDMIMEDDRIDLMLPKPPRKKQSTLKAIRTKRNRKDKQVASRLPGSNKDRLEDEETIRQSSKVSTDPARHKATGERSGRGSRYSRAPSPQLSIVDIYKYHKATTQSTPPPFLKVAQRTAKKRLNQAREGPGRKVFVLETENDTREVQAVLREWREGTLGAIAYTQTLTLHNKQTQEAGQFNGMDTEYPGRSAQEPHAFPRISSRAEPVQRQANEKSDQSKFPAVSLPTVAFDKPRNPPVTKPRRLRQTFLKPTVIPAQVQALSGEFHYPKKAQFSRAMTPVIDILRAQRPASPTGFNHPALEKFLQDDDLVVSPLAQLRKERKQLQSVSAPSAAPSPSLRELQQTYTTKHLPQRKRIRRKNTPQRIDADVRERRQPPQENVPVDDSIPIQIDPIPVDQAPSLTGLAPYGTRYSLNFDTHALRPGTVFHSETFIGCGGLSRALSTSPAHQRGTHTRIATCNVANQTLNWGVYRDGIASEFEIIMDAIMDSIDKAHAESSPQNLDAHLLASQVYTFYQFCSNYVADILHFSDSVDVVSFGQRFLSVLQRCSKRLCTEIPNPTGRPDLALPSIKLAIYTHCFTVTLAFQIQRLFSGATEAVRKSLGFESLVRDFGKTLITALLRCGIQAIRQCYEDQRLRVRFERGLGKESYIVEAWVMAIYILGQASPSINVFWKTLNFELHCDELVKVADISIYERCWKTIFTLLPLFQFDSQGVVGQHGKREHPLVENWELLKQLASSFLNHYKANGDKPTINDYCRIIYTRTHHLITKWGWINPEPMIATLFNFFARNSLPNLRNEPDRGSPLFLQQLNSQPSLAAEDLDVCFHLLLKIIAITLQSMSTSSSTKKIRDYVFRLMPNHRRHNPKEEDLRIEHLVALRNHHDLLCTLYWASPPICRPPLSAIRDLVDPGTSHRQACAVSVRAWSYLIRFQLHSDEDIVQLTPFMDWYDDISEQILAQHNSCRAEATKQFRVERERGRIDISEADIEDTIRRNQRQLEGLLQEAVRALGIAMAGIKGRFPNAMKLLTPASIGILLSSFTKVSNKLLGEVLEVVTLYVDTCLYNPTPISQPYSLLEQASEESQDYGDWSGMEDLVLGEEKKAAGQHLLTVVYEPLLRMVSNALGADQQPADVLLLKAIDTWAKVGGYLVQQGLKTWEMYLDSYSRDSWASFRDTPQTRKFTAYYMCKLVQNYPDAYSLNKPTFISYWLRTLVERNSMLYYQHALTSALLNADLQNPLFHNLPFAKSDANVYEISLTELEARRLSLIGTFLANMRISYDQSTSTSITNQLRAEYSSMLSYLMNSMRENYLTLQQLQQNPVKPGIANNTNSSTSTDAYVAFVQEVVSLLQQHTPDICPIDKFFTDSSVFPLPADDPTYVIGKLRNYALKLTLPRTHKQLTAFFQTLCERAAIDGEQDYLVNQLVLAMEGERESGGKTMTLRSFLMRTVFPVYVQCAFGWGSPGLMLAMPIGKAVIRVLTGIRTELDSCDFQAVQGVVYTLSGWIEGVLRAFVERFVNKEIMQGWICNGPSPVSAMLILVVESLERCLPVLDWLLVQADESSDIVDVARGNWFTERKRIISMVTALVRVVVWIDKNIFSSPSGTSFQGFYEIQGLSSIIANTTSPIYGGRGSNFINDLQLHHIQYSYLSSLCSSLTREWHSNPLNSNETTLFRNGTRRFVHSKSINAWKEMFNGLDDSKRCVSFVKKVLVEFLERTARTEIWGGVVMEEARSIWEGEVGKRGRPGRMGRAKWAGVAELFC